MCSLAIIISGSLKFTKRNRNETKPTKRNEKTISYRSVDDEYPSLKKKQKNKKTKQNKTKQNKTEHFPHFVSFLFRFMNSMDPLFLVHSSLGLSQVRI